MYWNDDSKLFFKTFIELLSGKPVIRKYVDFSRPSFDPAMALLFEFSVEKCIERMRFR